MLVGNGGWGKFKSFNETVPLVDEVEGVAGGVATVFQRINAEGRHASRGHQRQRPKTANGLWAPTSPPFKPDGTKNPVIETLLNGKTYMGRAFVVNDWYTTAYKPLKNPGTSGWGCSFLVINKTSPKAIIHGNRSFRKANWARRVYGHYWEAPARKRAITSSPKMAYATGKTSAGRKTRKDGSSFRKWWSKPWRSRKGMWEFMQIRLEKCQ
jgi:hypothetical protein